MPGAHRPRSGGALTGVGFALLIPGWIALWTTSNHLNPLAFTLMWSGASLLMWSASREYPGIRRHLTLAAISVPLWWYFEAINRRTENWEYLGRDRYDDFEFALLASVTFATVVPALVAATAMIGRLTRELLPDTPTEPGSRRLAHWLIVLGIIFEALTLALPAIFYPLVWIAPFLFLDGLVILVGGSSIISELSQRALRRASVIGAAGLLCGGLWEFWNFWSFPKWIYDVPLFDFLPIFEMPILGYGGYVPFAWSVLQLVQLMDIASDGVKRRFRIFVS
jgi:hypothetical protein